MRGGCGPKFCGTWRSEIGHGVDAIASGWGLRKQDERRHPVAIPASVHRRRYNRDFVNIPFLGRATGGK